MNELDLLKEFRGRVEGPTPEKARAAKAKFMASLHGYGRSEPAQSRNTLGRWAITRAAAAVAVALVIVLPATLLTTGAGPGGLADATVLEQVATVAAQRPATASPRPGQFVYTKSENAYVSFTLYDVGEAYAVMVPHTREIWIAPDGSGRLLETSGDPSFLSEEDRTAWVAAGSPTLPGGNTSDKAFGPGGLSFTSAAGLPTQPDALREALEARASDLGSEGKSGIFATIGGLLRETYVAPAVRSALYEVTARFPGVEYVGSVKDAAGREGIAVGYAHKGIRHDLIFDPDTSELLGERDVVVDAALTGLNVADGEVIGYSAYLASGVVDTTSATAGGA